MAKTVNMWAIMRGDGSALATQRLYPYARARRLVRLARRLGLDVYASRFGRVAAPRRRMSDADLQDMMYDQL